MKYRILQQNSTAIPFSLFEFDNFNDCLCKLNELIDDREDCSDPKYYVLNKFYKNIYELVEPITKYSIECSEDNIDWVLYEKPKEYASSNESTEKLKNINLNINLNIKIIN